MQATNSSNSKVRQLAIDALFIALTFVATWLINIRLPFMGQGGLIHLGNVPLFVAAMLFGKRTGFLAGAFGMGLFDLLSGWTAWAPFTFLIVGCMGFVIGLLSEHKPCKINFVNNVLCVIVAVIIKVVGYYFAEVILFGNWITPCGSIPGNILQVAVAGVIALVLVPQLQRFVQHSKKNTKEQAYV